MFKKVIEIKELECPDCALNIIERVESLEYIKTVFVDFDNLSLTIESEQDISQEKVDAFIHSLNNLEHEMKHNAYLNNMQSIVTAEYKVEKDDTNEEQLGKVEKVLRDNQNKNVNNAVTKRVFIKKDNSVEVYNIASFMLNDEKDEHDEGECTCEHHHHHNHHEHCSCGCEDLDDTIIHNEETNISTSIKEELNGIVVSKYYFEDIDCANCAAKYERLLNKDSQIIEARVNYIAKTILVKHQKNVNVLKILTKILYDIEPDAYIVNGDNEQKLKNKAIASKIKNIINMIGAIIFIIGIVLLHIGEEEITGNLGFDPLIPEDIFIILAYSIFITAYVLLSYDLFYKSLHSIIHGDVFNESLLMVIASLGALVLAIIEAEEFMEPCAVIFLYKVGEHYQNKATEKSKNAIKELIELKRDTVTLKDGTIKNIKEVNVGEIITIKVGEQIPLDGVIMNNPTNLDTKALTGESIPVYKGVGEEILSGSINLTKVIDVEVTKIDTDSTMTKVLQLVEEASNQKSKSEQFITKFAHYYTPAILILALVVFLIQALTGWGVEGGKSYVEGALYNIFTILVIACPCALVISIPLGYFAGIGRYSANGILVKGGNYIETLSNVKTFVFDKTGTITKGNFKVTDIVPANGHTEEEVLELIAESEQFSMHPIANSIREAYNKEIQSLDNASVEEIAGAGIKLFVDGKRILVGNKKLMKSYSIDYQKHKNVGTILYLAVNKEYYGCVVIRDEIKEESFSLLKYLNDNGYKTVMLTGDNEGVAKYVAETVGISEYYAKILPYDKYLKLNEIMKNSDDPVCYVGDGINDTPSLRRADVSIAMGGIGSDSAKECADIVIMNDDISKIVNAIDISRYTKKIVLENIIFSLCVKLFALVVSVTGILENYAIYVALFADVGVCILAILNVIRILRYKSKTLK